MELYSISHEPYECTSPNSKSHDVEWASNLLTCVFTVTHVPLELGRQAERPEGLGKEPQYHAKMDTEDKNTSPL